MNTPSLARAFVFVSTAIITPLFLFSGTFFPVTQLPRPFQLVAMATPLYHGVELVRGLSLRTLAPGAWMLHVLYLSGLAIAGTAVALAIFRRRLMA